MQNDTQTVNVRFTQTSLETCRATVEVPSDVTDPAEARRLAAAEVDADRYELMETQFVEALDYHTDRLQIVDHDTLDTPDEMVETYDEADPLSRVLAVLPPDVDAYSDVLTRVMRGHPMTDVAAYAEAAYTPDGRTVVT